MSFNQLVGGDCGGNNALVQLSNIVSRDATISQPLSQSDMFVNEFMAQNYKAPQTFNMNSLLKNLPETETNKNHQKLSVIQGPVRSFQPASMSNAWGVGPSTSYIPPQLMQRPHFSQHPLIHHQNPANFPIEYISEAELKNDSQNLQQKAQEYINIAKDDDKLNYNQFMDFMKKVSAGELNLVAPINDNSKTMKTKDEMFDEIAEKYKDEWDRLSNVNNFWDSEEANGIPKEYIFAESNVMLENKSALEIGKEKLQMGDVPGAVLCFEAAAQQEPNSAEAWFLLGTTQTENEQDPQAITALKKSLELDPTQLKAYITLAAAYTNENMPKFAFVSLIKWLKANPKYSDLIPEDIDPLKLDLKELENHVKTLFLRAAQMDPMTVDPQVQSALGVVFNITQEYEKAIDCFKTALMVANDDSKLWNRLGATLANSEKSEEAVEAYHQALNLEPGFIRARYNVGITCMNLGAYKEAAEHFLVALNQQFKAKSMYPETADYEVGSSSIWTTLRMVCSFMGEHDITKFVDNRNLKELNNFFGVES